jgi:hypothetical protein
MMEKKGCFMAANTLQKFPVKSGLPKKTVILSSLLPQMSFCQMFLNFRRKSFPSVIGSTGETPLKRGQHLRRNTFLEIVAFQPLRRGCYRFLPKKKMGVVPVAASAGYQRPTALVPPKRSRRDLKLTTSGFDSTNHPG